MKREVYITVRAERELKAAADFIAQRAPAASRKWYHGFVEAILEIGENPFRFSVVQEHRELPVELRQLLYGRRRSYRAIFTVRDDRIVVVAVRHAAQSHLKPEDLVDH